jgi:exosortase D (VPLPA-CTERM-specific)
MHIIIEGIRIRPESWLKALGYTMAIAMVYYSALIQLVCHDWAREDYSHCGLIPLVVLYFIWEKRERLTALPSVPSAAGFLPFLSGIGLYWVGELGGEYFTIYFSLWLVIVGLAWIHLGWKKIRTVGFALAVMLAMFPFPNFMSVRISLFLQLVSSRLGVWMLHLSGMSAYREGNVIDLGFTQLQVVDACSGLRYMIPMMILSLILAYWFRARFWKRTVLFLSAIPLAIFMNSFRIAVTGILYGGFGAKVAEGFFHGFSGWLLFVVAIPLLFGVMWVLRCCGGEVQRECGGAVEADELSPSLSAAIPQCRIFAATLSILLITFAASYGVEFREKVPIKRSFSEFPMIIGSWSGTRQAVAEEYVDALRFTEYIMAGFRNPEGREIDFYAAYLESQRKGEGTHSPETCLPGSGWTIRPAGLADISAGNGKTIQVNRSFLEKGDSRLMTYFWFPQRGRILTSLFQVKIFSFWDALTRHRTDGALVRVITPLYPGEENWDAEKRLNGFTTEMQRVLEEFLPS